jgi:deoxyribose-phosphate aldolase
MTETRRELAAMIDHTLLKASGGIRTAQAALALVDAGTTRLGLSPAAVLTEPGQSARRV